MTIRVFLAAVTFSDDENDDADLPAERVFINAADVPEVWVETESGAVPEVGRPVTFALQRTMNLGWRRISGTVERRVQK